MWVAMVPSTSDSGISRASVTLCSDSPSSSACSRGGFEFEVAARTDIAAGRESLDDHSRTRADHRVELGQDPCEGLISGMPCGEHQPHLGWRRRSSVMGMTKSDATTAFAGVQSARFKSSSSRSRLHHLPHRCGDERVL